MQQLEIVVQKAVGLKHDGRHCVEFLLDGHGPERTPWVDDLYDTTGMVVQPKNFKSSKRTIQLKSGANYEGAFLHVTLYHQRTLRDDKRAAEAHLPFSRMTNFSGWVALEHKEKYGGKIFIDATLRTAPVAVTAVTPTSSDPEVAEQMAILASIQSSRSPEKAVNAWPEWPQQTQQAQQAQAPLPAPASPPALMDEPPEWLSWPEFRTALAVGSLRASHVGCAEGRRKALLVAPSYAGAAERRCTQNDVLEVSRILLRLGFPEPWTLKLVGHERASRTKIVEALKWLTHNAVSGDVLFFHYSGHCVLHEDASGQLVDAYCPEDFHEAGYLPARECYDLISQLPKGVRLTMLVDSMVPCACPLLPYVWDGAQWTSTGLEACAADVVGLGSGDGEMTPEQLAEASGAEQGAITKSFLQAMQDLASQRKGPVSYAALLAEASRHLRGTGHERLQLSATRCFDLSRSFRFFDSVP